MSENEKSLQKRHSELEAIYQEYMDGLINSREYYSKVALAVTNWLVDDSKRPAIRK